MTNTINNVPRELLERVLNAGWGSETANALDDLRDFLESATSSANHVEDVRAMVAAPSPAGVDGLEVATFLHTLHMELGQTEQFCSKWKGDPFGIAGEDYSSTYAVTSDPLCRLSDAQTIIDGLRGEVAAQEETANQWRELALQFDRHRMTAMAHIRAAASGDKSAIEALGVFAALPPIPGHEITAERDQQAQRIGELEGLLRDFAYHTQRREMPTESSLAEWADRIDSTLSAGKEGG